MRLSKVYPFFAILISLGLLIPGVTQPMITLKAQMNRQAVVAEGKKILGAQELHPAIKSMASQFLNNIRAEGQLEVYNKTRSILGTSEDLWRHGYQLVALLIVLFSIIIPAIKLLLILTATFSTNQRGLFRLNAILGKWSMADVFAMGIIISLLAANANSSESSIINFQTTLHEGFYWFLAYCLLSIVISQLLPGKNPPCSQ